MEEGTAVDPERVPREGTSSVSLVADRQIASQVLKQTNQRCLEFSADDAVGTSSQQILCVQRSVEAVETEMTRFVQVSDTLACSHPQSDRGVHRDGYADEVSILDFFLVERFNSKVKTLDW